MNYVLLVVGLLILMKGADILIDSASKIAKILGIPAFIVGLLIVAIGTSAPETAIGVFSGIQGTNLITLGDVVGSCIINIALVLAVTAMILPLRVDPSITKKVIPISIAVQILLIVMLYTQFELSRIESLILIGGMILFFGYIVYKPKRLADRKKLNTLSKAEMIDGEGLLAETATKENPDVQISEPIQAAELLEETTAGENKLSIKVVLMFFLGLAGLIGGANLAVNNAVDIAHHFNLSEEFIGLTIIAFGTSLPELVTCLIAAFKKEEDIAVGNIVGSNIFNILLVLGLSGTIHPIAVGTDIFLDLFVMLGVSLLLFATTFFYGRISRKSGYLFFATFMLYFGYKLIGIVHLSQ